jgi:hypothetical protein
MGRLPRLLYLSHICENFCRQDANGRDMQHFVKLLCPWVVSNLGPLVFRLWESSTIRDTLESFEETARGKSQRHLVGILVIHYTG